MARNSYYDDLSMLASELRAKEREQMAALELAQRRLEETRKQREAIETTLALMRQRFGISEPSNGLQAKDLVGMTYEAALIEFAKANEGKVRVLKAKPIFIAAGIAKNPKTAYQQITAVLIRSKRFEWCDSGTYQLVDETSETPEAPAPPADEQPKSSLEELPQSLFAG